jgi:hypothetical protein
MNKTITLQRQKLLTKGVKKIVEQYGEVLRMLGKT